MFLGKTYYVYIITNDRHTVLYTGITGNLRERIEQHKHKYYRGFTSKYNVHKLVWYAEFGNPIDAITQEKQIKGGSRRKKIALIESANKDWKELSWK